MQELKIPPVDSSRRRFLSMSLVAAGAVMLGGMSGCTRKLGPVNEEAGTWQPMPYVAMDPQAVRERAYNGYYQWHS